MQRFQRIFSLLFLLCTMAIPVSGYADVPPISDSQRETIAELPAVKGAQSTNFSSLRNKPLLVTFFASWCPPCREEFAHLNRLQERYLQSDLRIIAINVYEAWDENDAARMDSFIKSTQPQFPALTGSEQIRDIFGGIDRIPTVYGFDRRGDLVYRFIHKRGSKKTNAAYDELEKAVTDLLLTDSN